MKVQKQLSKKRGDKIYHKYVIVLPENIIKEAKLKEGDDLDVEVKNGEVRLKKK
jgi:bifunctional DNA-binding transcriptional regulator/antitoxin component of YhaV-PrlF toxin-antitoxin module